MKSKRKRDEDGKFVEKPDSERMAWMCIRPSVTEKDLADFRAECKRNGETMTSVVRRFIMKIARGDRELLNRIVT